MRKPYSGAQVIFRMPEPWLGEGSLAQRQQLWLDRPAYVKYVCGDGAVQLAILLPNGRGGYHFTSLYHGPCRHGWRAEEWRWPEEVEGL